MYITVNYFAYMVTLCTNESMVFTCTFSTVALKGQVEK